MNYIVFDLEFNNSSSQNQKINVPLALSNEIIQIGAIKMDRSFKIVDTLDILVKPVYYTKISRRVKRVIGMYHRSEEEALSFVNACKCFFDFCGEDCCLFSWGPRDVEILKENMLAHGLSIANIPHCYDLQKSFSTQLKNEKRQIKLQKAVKMVRETCYTAHNAFNDAYSTAQILSHCNIEIKADGTLKIICKKSGQKPFDVFLKDLALSREETIKIVSNISVTCKCGRKNAVCGLFSSGKSKMLAASSCDCGAEYLITVKIKRSEDNKIKIECYKENMTAELKDSYLKKKEIDDAIKAYALKKKAQK